MARKKKIEVKEAVEKKVPAKKVVEKTKKKLRFNPGVGEILWVDYNELPGTVLGRVYEFENGVKARLTYLDEEKAKLIIE